MVKQPITLSTPIRALQHAVDQMAAHLEERGLVFLQFQDGDEEQWCDAFLKTGQSLGLLIEHNPGKRDYSWAIKKKCEDPTQATFSQHAGEAYYHTDAQYRNQPDQYMGLLCIKPAECGGGINSFLDFQLIKAEMEKSEDGRKWLDLAQSVLFPFLIPKEFRIDDQAYLLKPIIMNGGGLRFRLDTMLNGLKLYPEYLTETRIWIVETFRSFLDQRHTTALKAKLATGSMVFLDNHRWLHARSAFSDPTRHLKRIRLDRFN